MNQKPLRFTQYRCCETYIIYLRLEKCENFDSIVSNQNLMFNLGAPIVEKPSVRNNLLRIAHTIHRRKWLQSNHLPK